MKKLILTVVILVITIVLTIYSAYAFYNLSFDPSIWAKESRGVCAIICSTIIVVGTLVSIQFDDEPSKTLLRE